MQGFPQGDEMRLFHGRQKFGVGGEEYVTQKREVLRMMRLFRVQFCVEKVARFLRLSSTALA
jgi:hypothetical protein